ncbi:MAG: hypothetical protein K0Q73_8270 [Paenibacillus sp.]|nr:hypothetical protein [Paenibacillus sp.]
MKKWMFGLLSAVIVMLLTAAVPSSTIQGTLFPSIVTIHNGNEAKTIEGTGDNGVINYNNKAYIPLRLFSEEMGASVGYEPASEATNGLHKIDIYQGIAPISWSLERTDLIFSQATDICSSYNFPFYIIPAQFPRIADDKDDTHNFNLKVHNLMPDDISVKPIELTFEVTDEANNIIYSRPLPPVTGVIPSKFGFNAVVLVIKYWVVTKKNPLVFIGVWAVIWGISE